eukprot:1401396-Rhodomonas_salina.2
MPWNTNARWRAASVGVLEIFTAHAEAKQQAKRHARDRVCFPGCIAREVARGRKKVAPCRLQSRYKLKLSVAAPGPGGRAQPG